MERARRQEYDGSEWWSYQELPKIPKECAAQAEASPAQATMPQPEAVIAHLKVLWGEKYITTEVIQAVEETIDYIECKVYRQRHQRVVEDEAPALKCSDCQAKSADCAHGQLRGSQSCIDTINRHQQART